MGGGADGGRDEAAVEELYARHCRPMPLAEFRDWYARVCPPDAARGFAEPRCAGRFS